MANLAVEFGGIKSPNPFWLASGPLTNTEYQVSKAFDLGWGGAVWKTVGEPTQNVTSRLGSLDYGGRRMMGLNNIELISDRPIEDNLREIASVKRRYPQNALIVSLMLEPRPEAWRDIVRRCEDTGADALELNFGCPHGMSERGMGAAVGQVPQYTCDITGYARQFTKMPVIVKLTPNVTDIRYPARAAVDGGADALSLINTINSVIGVDIDRWVPSPQVDGKGSHGGYCGPAVKPIALHMLSSLANDPAISVPLVGMGGIETWRDAVEYFLLGATAVQVCTAAMHYGFRIIDDLTAGLSHYMEERGIQRVSEMVGQVAPKLTNWADLNLGYQLVASIDETQCIGCNLCYIACDDGGHQCIDRVPGLVAPQVRQADCVGCNLCAHVCPVPGCIEMIEVDSGRPQETFNEQQARRAFESALSRGRETV